MKIDKIAIILLNYNSSDDCRKCISFLKKQQGVDTEIIVVDNSSRDDDKKAVEKLCQQEQCTFITSTENRGYNAGNNIGLRYAAKKGYEYALIANPDMEFPQHDYLAKTVACIKEREDVVVVASDIVSPNGIHQNPYSFDEDWNRSFAWLKLIFNKINKENNKKRYNKSGYCEMVTGCCLLVHTKFIQQINFFDEYPFLYCEESILARQVQIAGKKMYYLSEKQAIHRHIKSAKGNPIPRFKQLARSKIYFLNKYSNRNWFSKKIAILSAKLHIWSMMLICKLRNETTI